ncbi:subtilisin-like protease SBT4.15 [Beta vulgaris subsp. vulgaris]|uniref:subtilisin-like protease SBT4.15 n=1 Tax=Beta vulgaris subsp. vulgaris TaxID=3555 RepID=UPI0009010D2D|nr:subtilisin-like protease SBT4.15 [Beta vulgaris subsp. vulgaris]
MKNIIILLLIINFGVTLIQGLNDDGRKSYIVYMGDISQGIERLAVVKHHHSLLAEAIGDESIARVAKIHSYGKSFNGFAARLLPHEASRLSEKRNVVSVFPNKMRKLLTTRSWDYLGMPEDLRQRNNQTESSIILGLLDTGIYIDAPSFSDEGYGPPPSKWKGTCEKGLNFTGCNRKVIGARYYNLGPDIGMDPTPVDTDGHGTHTSSTAAGRSVNGASLFGVAEGTARGGVPNSRIAMYKVCGNFGCSDMSLLAGFDDAIADGVDIISISIGGPTKNFMDDVVAIGSFHAMKKGILTVCAGGNEGPDEGSISNVAPWVLTVGATNVDREFRTVVELGNGMKLQGMSINTFSPKKTMYPLISAASAFNGTESPFTNVSMCDAGTLSESKVKGKIVLCLGLSSADWTVRSSHGAGTIIALDELQDMASTTLLPASFVSAEDGHLIGDYINTTKSPQATIYKTVTLKTTKAPVVASFSSRGPQLLARNILKPDISAPGMDILAAYSKLVSITNENLDNRFSYFNIISGTSMACPHVAGAAAYVKTFHPDWSPAAIKSALMTTAKPVNGNGTENPLDSGSGLINPVAAVHPGLIYDLSGNDYIRYLCREGYNGTTLSLIQGLHKKVHYNCSKVKPGQGADGLNYPSLHVQLPTSDTKISKVFHRSVTHVGYGPAVYKATVTSPRGLAIKVIPDVLTFTKPHQKQSFKVLVQGTITDDTPYTLSAFLEWNDSKYRVRSPVVIYRSIV